MNTFEVANFIKKIGFGLGPDETAPSDPLEWAMSQFDKVTPLGFLAKRDGSLMQSGIEEVKLLKTQAEVAEGLHAHQQAEDLTFEKSKTLSKTDWEKFRYETVDYPYWQFEPWKEMLVRGAMSVNGQEPVAERFWHFWTNHFTVAPATNNINTAVGPYQRMLRNRMNGSFRDMLFEAITHPAMVLYLDNQKSTGPNSKHRREQWSKDEINENLGRELLELFTVSPQAGYTQADVLNVTYILTGWGVEKPDKWHKLGIPLGSKFEFNRHEPGTHTVMGKKYSAFVRNDGKLNDLVDDLAVHPATAQHIANKLATAFIADDPSPDLVDRISKVFLQSKGHLPTVHKAVVSEVFKSTSPARKFLDPETWLWTIHRLTGTSLPLSFPHQSIRGEKIHQVLAEIGQPIHNCPQPNGWSLKSKDWISREMLDRRVRYAFQFAPRISNPAETLKDLLMRQHGLDSTIAKNISIARQQGNTQRVMWTAYLTSPDLMWS